MSGHLSDEGGITRRQAKHPVEARDGIALLLCVDSGNLPIMLMQRVPALLAGVAILAGSASLKADAIARKVGGRRRVGTARVLMGRLHFLTLVSPAS